jgi:hypothetical protein
MRVTAAVAQNRIILFVIIYQHKNEILTTANIDEIFQFHTDE